MAEVRHASSRMTQLQARIAASADVLDLSHGYPDGLMPAWIHEHLRSLAAAGWPLAMEGCAAVVRGHFAALFGDYPVHLTSTASEALLLAFDAALGAAGGEILTLDETFDAYEGLARMCRGRVHHVERSAPGAAPDLDRLVRRISSDTRALLITQPENPLGWVYPPDQLARLVRIALERRLTLIVDSAFAEVCPPEGGIRHLTREYADPELRVLAVGDTGKLISLHGLRIGALIASQHFAGHVVAAASNLAFRFDAPRLCTLAAILADSRLADHRRVLARQCRDNFAIFAAGVGPLVALYPPPATSVAVLTIPGFPADDFAFTDALLAAERVAVVPMSAFFHTPVVPTTPGCRVRVSLARPAALVHEAAIRLRRFVEGNHGRMQ